MRTAIDFSKDWFFLRRDADVEAVLAEGIRISLPHTWNALDGQDGGNDYYRGTCQYAKRFDMPQAEADDEVWLEFQGVAMTAVVKLNGDVIGRHEGGYSTFRLNLTQSLKKHNLLSVAVNNGHNDRVYPQKADFTFYGGIYRDVKLIIVHRQHFAMTPHGTPGMKITPILSRNSATVKLEAWMTGGEAVQFSASGQVVSAPVVDGYATGTIVIDRPRLWDGVNDPFLYVAMAELVHGGHVTDRIESTFGCRTIAFDAENGFILNGRPYRLCGAARHQDREGVGSALTRADHEEDMALLREMGANTVRLGHYQHDSYFYDLCDQYGLVVWAEIPYITSHLAAGNENAADQLTELILQNYNHPSIICWGLSNEITVATGVTDAIQENHRLLNELAHALDETRPTAMAHAFMLDFTDPFVMLTDIRSYNLYYGWYLGDMAQNDAWLDDFHARHPDAIIGLSEYGADANPAYQSANPERGDWSESYQAAYHEHMLKMWQARPYIWAMHAWNMFDFGADGRGEGGKPGQNQKGLVTFDRKLKKDAFFLYKAYLSKEPFVHLCGRRYVDRCEGVTEIKVYSNQPSVTLRADGKLLGTQNGDKVFSFQVPLSSRHVIVAQSGSLYDTIEIRKAHTPNPTYISEGGQVENWFDRSNEIARDGYYSILDTVSAIKSNAQGAAVLAAVMIQVARSYGDVAQDVVLPEPIQRQMDAMPLAKFLRQAGKVATAAMVQELNHALNKIEKNNGVCNE